MNHVSGVGTTIFLLVWRHGILFQGKPTLVFRAPKWEKMVIPPKPNLSSTSHRNTGDTSPHEFYAGIFKPTPPAQKQIGIWFSKNRLSQTKITKVITIRNIVFDFNSVCFVNNWMNLKNFGICKISIVYVVLLELFSAYLSPKGRPS